MTEPFVHRGVKIQRHGRRWRWRVRAQGTVIVRSHPDLLTARQQLDEFLAQRDRESARTEFGGSGPTIQELCESWFRSKKAVIAPGTAQQYEIHIRVHIVPRLGNVGADLVRPRDLESFYASLRWKAAKEAHNVLRQAFDWGLRNDELTRVSNPSLAVRPSRRACIDDDGFFDTDDRVRPIDEKQIPTRLDVEKLLLDAECRKDSTWWLYLRLAVATGARPGELCALQRKSLDMSRSTIRIEWSADRVSGRLKRPKTIWSIRTLHLDPALLSEIESILPDHPDAFLFPSNTYRGSRSLLPCWNARTVKRRLDSALGRTGSNHFTPHAFRHFAATHLLDQGWSPLQVARYLGHANDALVRSLYANHIVDQTQREIGGAASRLV